MYFSGLHHTSSYTADLRKNIDFYTEVLGLRLVMKSVNQDDPSMYHLAYGDAVGRPGTLLTFFDLPTAAPHQPRRDDVSEIALALPGEAALSYWKARLAEAGVLVDHKERNGHSVLSFTDPEGHRLSLVDTGPNVKVKPWTESAVPPRMALQGLFSVTLTVKQLEPTARFFLETLNLQRKENGSSRSPSATSFRVGAHQEVRIVENPDLPKRGLGAGGVHHVAFGVAKETLPAWRERLTDAGHRVSGVIDRHYAAALYVREPNGVLVELSSNEFNLGDLAHLGETLLLPPVLEPKREAIEASLTPLPLNSERRMAYP